MVLGTDNSVELPADLPEGHYEFYHEAARSGQRTPQDMNQGILFDEAPAHSRTGMVAPTAPIAAALLSQVREPDPADMAGWATLADVATWAKLQGDITSPTSMAGTLIRLFIRVSEVAGLLISEMATIPPAHFESELESWKFADAPDALTCDVSPNSIDLGRANAFYNATRIHSDIIYARAKANSIWHELYVASIEKPAPQATKTILLREPMNPTNNVDGDLVNLGSVIDSRLSRDIPVLADDVYAKGIENDKFMC